MGSRQPPLAGGCRLLADNLRRDDCRAAPHTHALDVALAYVAERRTPNKKPEGFAMFYVQRDAQGQLIRVEAAAYAEATETLPADHLEIQTWFANEAVEVSLKQLKQSDLEMIRVLDDLIQVLTSKGVIRVTDLPAAAQAKLMDRTQARVALGGLSRLINDDETGLI
ncbi:tryptophan synthase subunit beta like protein [Pseudomonas sp. Os17]|nr:tryptophan synthase subunit beta like protein [Pseudomonas sp. Os17]BAQ78019.1 tryptophan synthase subunit beta like protein [Pseudomonas sp. St29]